MTRQLSKSFFWKCACLALLTILIYIPAMRGQFTWDDDVYILNNPFLNSTDGLSQIWLRIGSIVQYYPLTFTTFWIENHIWGLDPLAFHIDNVLLHIAGAMTLWSVLRKLEIGGAWAIAMIFAIHPIQVESVAWAMERKNVLSGLLFLLSLRIYLSAVPLNREPGRQMPVLIYAASLILFVLALFSKSTASSLPAVILVLTWWKRGRIGIADLLPLAPFFVFGIAMGSLTGWMERHFVGAVGPEYDFSILQRIAIAGRAAWFYVWKIAWPARQIFIYPRWNIDPVNHPWQMIFPASAAAAVIALLMLRKKIGRGPLAAALIFGGMLAPAMGLVNIYPMRFSFVADHFQYLAGAALVTLVVCGARRVLPTVMQRGGLAIVICVFAVLTFRQGFAYASQETLWLDTLAKNPDCTIAQANYAVILMNRNDPNAEAALRRVLVLDPHHFRAMMNLGLLSERKRDLPGAIKWFEAALAELPDSDDAVLRAVRFDPCVNLGDAYSMMADAENYHQAEARYRALSVRYYQLAARANPNRSLPTRARDATIRTP